MEQTLALNASQTLDLTYYNFEFFFYPLELRSWCGGKSHNGTLPDCN